MPAHFPLLLATAWCGKSRCALLSVICNDPLPSIQPLFRSPPPRPFLLPVTRPGETSASVVPLSCSVSLCCPVCLLLRLRPEGSARESATQLAHRVSDPPCHRAAEQGWPTNSVSLNRVGLLACRFCFPTHPPGGFLPHPAISYTGGGFDGASRNLELNQLFYRQSRKGGRGPQLVGCGARKADSQR